MSALPKRPWQEPSQICVTEDSVEALYEKEKIRRELDGEKGFNTEEGRRRVPPVLCAGPVKKPCSPRGAHADLGGPQQGAAGLAGIGIYGVMSHAAAQRTRRWASAWRWAREGRRAATGWATASGSRWRASRWVSSWPGPSRGCWARC